MNSSARIALLALGIALLAGALSCNKAGRWRDQQITQSHNAAQGSKLQPPATPISLPDAVREALPVDPSFTVLEYSANGAEVHVKALSAWDAAQTSQWVLGEMARRGYRSEDNPSRILEGLEFFSEQDAGRAMLVSVTRNTAEQCVVTIDSR